MKLLIDGDIIRYRCGFAGQHTYYDWYHKDDVCVAEDHYVTKGEPIAKCENAKESKAWIEAAKVDAENHDRRWERGKYVRVPRATVDPLENILHSVKIVMENIINRYAGYEPIVFFSCPTEDNWRTQFYPEYKANRKAHRKPYYDYQIELYMEQKWGVTEDPHKEADDLISETAYQCSLTNEPCVVVTIDKDMLQIPGTHYNWVKEEERVVDGMLAMRFLSEQILAGDSTDNIKGIPGWGAKTAIDWLMRSESPDIREVLSRAYRLAYDTKAEARYNMALTEALVTLPVTDEHRKRLTEAVAYEKSRIKKPTTNDEPLDSTSGGTE